MGVRTNPWAKACGEMVKEVLKREVEGEEIEGVESVEDGVWRRE